MSGRAFHIVKGKRGGQDWLIAVLLTLISAIPAVPSEPGEGPDEKLEFPIRRAAGYWGPGVEFFFVSDPGILVVSLNLPAREGEAVTRDLARLELGESVQFYEGSNIAGVILPAGPVVPGREDIPVHAVTGGEFVCSGLVTREQLLSPDARPLREGTEASVRASRVAIEGIGHIELQEQTVRVWVRPP